METKVIIVFFFQFRFISEEGTFVQRIINENTTCFQMYTQAGGIINNCYYTTVFEFICIITVHSLCFKWITAFTGSKFL